MKYKSAKRLSSLIICGFCAIPFLVQTLIAAALTSQAETSNPWQASWIAMILSRFPIPSRELHVDGSFSTSDELINRIHTLINRAMLSNMFSVLTDCPHREKLGWLEQTHLAGASLMSLPQAPTRSNPQSSEHQLCSSKGTA